MDFRPGGGAVRSALVVACVTHRGHTGEGKNAGRSCFLCAEAGGEGRQAVQVS